MEADPTKSIVTPSSIPSSNPVYNVVPTGPPIITPTIINNDESNQISIKKLDDYPRTLQPFYPVLRYRSFDEFLNTISEVPYNLDPLNMPLNLQKNLIIIDQMFNKKTAIKAYGSGGILVNMIGRVIMTDEFGTSGRSDHVFYPKRNLWKSNGQPYTEADRGVKLDNALVTTFDFRGAIQKGTFEDEINNLMMANIARQFLLENDPTPLSIVVSHSGYIDGSKNFRNEPGQPNIENGVFFTNHFLFFYQGRTDVIKVPLYNDISSLELTKFIESIKTSNSKRYSPRYKGEGINNKPRNRWWIVSYSPIIISIHQTSLLNRKKLLNLPRAIGYYNNTLVEKDLRLMPGRTIRDENSDYVISYEPTYPLSSIQSESEFKSLLFQTIYYLESMYYHCGYINKGISWNTLRIKNPSGFSNENIEITRNILQYKRFYPVINVENPNIGITPTGTTIPIGEPTKDKEWEIMASEHKGEIITILPIYKSESYLPFPVDEKYGHPTLKMSPKAMYTYFIADKIVPPNNPNDNINLWSSPYEKKNQGIKLHKWHINDLVSAFIVLASSVKFEAGSAKPTEEMNGFLNLVFDATNFLTPILRRVANIKGRMTETGTPKGPNWKETKYDILYIHGFLAEPKYDERKTAKTILPTTLIKDLVDFELFIKDFADKVKGLSENQKSDFKRIYPFHNEEAGQIKGPEKGLSSTSSETTNIIQGRVRMIKNIAFAANIGLFKDCLAGENFKKIMASGSLLDMDFFKSFIKVDGIEREGAKTKMSDFELNDVYIRPPESYSHKIFDKENPDYNMNMGICSITEPLTK